jgi:D-alanyl-D-alanine carboxypeptidase
MLKFVYVLIALALLSACQKAEPIAPDFYACRFSFADSSATNPNSVVYQSLIDDISHSGVAGITMSVYRPNAGMWMGASGKADLHNDINMKSCTISRVGSTVKMFTATTVLLLAEEGKLNLDDKISDYLQGDVINKIENAETVTIRQLLQHSGGIYNYIQNLNFQTASINDLIREWKPNDLLQYAYNRKAYFKPGADVRYSNTGYIMLGMLIEKLEGKAFYEVFREKLFLPLNLSATMFAATNHVPDGIARGYIDLYSNLQLIESTYFSGWDYYTADGGLISNPYDMSIFFQALMNGQIINANSLSQMLTWQSPKDLDAGFFPISYGLGIFKIETPYGLAYMHSGDAIGYYANMLYFPDDGTTIVYAVNSNYGKIDQYVSTKEAMQKIISEVMN